MSVESRDLFQNFFYASSGIKPGTGFKVDEVASSASSGSGTGFNIDEVASKAMKIEFLRKEIESVAKEGFRYAGDVEESNSTSKAYTDPKNKKIFIGKDKTTNEALLSLTYELMNAKNGQELIKIHDDYSTDILPEYSRALGYAQAVLRVESNAVYARSIIAIEVGDESLIKNKKYVEIVKKHGENHKAAIDEIFEEMLKNGTVHNGSRKAVDHYMSQYWKATEDNESEWAGRMGLRK